MPLNKTTKKKENILNAASTIVLEDGVSQLTLEGVADKAGVSKGGLLYHFSNKDALIEGMVADWSESYFQDIRDMAYADDNHEGKWTKAYVKKTFYDSDHNKQMNSAIMAAMFLNPELLEEFRRQYDLLIEELMDDGIDPIHATIARLATDGLWYSEILGLDQLNEGFKKQILYKLSEIIEEGK
ncbi:regulatory protein TetR [Gracilibacillus halophilus YIM-C55.5]|uniref:Regulatory protein TetR n=1 Tax=Gracilibacillus halophilus YIM-C55.5 TaxID=1308866 RepID=N4WBA5_9BACI|nr:TetR/AcrR family transcriptional regulator [Gracilibacillus halophilus]ENH97553.1 regulatory protein TetR [Gracilibacillus halophilus YIM-C55.5]